MRVAVNHFDLSAYHDLTIVCARNSDGGRLLVVDVLQTSTEAKRSIGTSKSDIESKIYPPQSFDFGGMQPASSTYADTSTYEIKIDAIGWLCNSVRVCHCACARSMSSSCEDLERIKGSGIRLGYLRLATLHLNPQLLSTECAEPCSSLDALKVAPETRWQRNTTPKVIVSLFHPISQLTTFFRPESICHRSTTLGHEQFGVLARDYPPSTRRYRYILHSESSR
jgi:hypothetical protein